MIAKNIRETIKNQMFVEKQKDQIIKSIEQFLVKDGYSKMVLNSFAVIALETHNFDVYSYLNDKYELSVDKKFLEKYKEEMDDITESQNKVNLVELNHNSNPVGLLRMAMELKNVKLKNLNDMQVIEKDSNMSINKFLDICKELNLNVTIILRDEDYTKNPMNSDLSWRSNL
jgi:hypothetical protein